ncbi:hypothetical protein ILUMI_01153 [Ignelater luminosus]|uniref:Uncharacterized protein n=1 Tax=Ignelater luminosus TaxID=2038154 RepID=A0A8K0GHQ6_IGNLU|nr:hypothetical protein ILUMI_01153 [Ignelater luminosus]
MAGEEWCRSFMKRNPKLSTLPLSPSLLNGVANSVESEQAIYIQQTSSLSSKSRQPVISLNGEVLNIEDQSLPAYSVTFELHNAANQEPLKTPTFSRSNSVDVQPSSSSSLGLLHLFFPQRYYWAYPKAPPSKTTNRDRKTKKSKIYTNTPEKENIRKEYKEKQRRLKAKQVKKNIVENADRKKAKKKQKKAKSIHRKPHQMNKSFSVSFATDHILRVSLEKKKEGNCGF